MPSEDVATSNHVVAMADNREDNLLNKYTKTISYKPYIQSNEQQRNTTGRLSTLTTSTTSKKKIIKKRENSPAMELILIQPGSSGLERKMIK